MRLLIFPFLALLCLPALCAPSWAAPAKSHKERNLGTFGAWRAYAYEEGGQTVCYMTSMKVIKTKKKKPRVKYLMVTHRPVEGSTDVFSYGAGIDLDSSHSVTVRIGQDVFDLFSARDTAWARDTITDHKITAAIRNGSTAKVIAIPVQSRVSTISDEFSLGGSSGAYRAINKACGLPDLQAVKKTIKKPVAKKTSKSKAKASVKKTASKAKAVVKTKKSKKSTAKSSSSPKSTRSKTTK
ncbi:MAG: hypothetical protein PHE27_04010 [Alphaproteobacteria bacterium]|nr:hypothetical protein [Alphaproteobacteria bacterium]